MPISFWCLFTAILLPYIWFTFAAVFRASQLGAAMDKHAPRAQDAELRGRAARAQGAHANSLAAVIVAHLTHADPEWSARLAVVFVACRVVHGIAYLGDRPPLRTAAFALGLLASIGLFVLAARA